MAVYACECMNVKIHTKEVHLVQNPCEDELQPFLGWKVAEVILDDLGIHIEQSYLLHRECLNSGWIQYQCVNCSWRTHAIQSAANTSTVLINLQLESDPAIHLRRTQSPDFSPVFNIVLKNHDLRDVKIPDGQVYESLESGVNAIQEQLDAFLEQERVAMEERIRTFELEQREVFSQVQSKCEKEKAHMISLVVKSATQELPRFDKGDNSGQLDCPQSPSSQVELKSKSKYSRSGPRTRSYNNYDQNPDSEALFYLDEVEPEMEEPFYDSGDEDLSGKSDGNSSNNRVMADAHPQDQSNLYSTSVPISVPMWRGRQSSSTEEEDEDWPTPANPDQMAANMQALAESIQDTGRYIFGERPRPRLNTGDGLTRYSERPRRRLNTMDSVTRRK